MKDDMVAAVFTVLEYCFESLDRKEKAGEREPGTVDRERKVTQAALKLKLALANKVDHRLVDMREIERDDVGSRLHFCLILAVDELCIEKKLWHNEKPADNRLGFFHFPQYSHLLGDREAGMDKLAENGLKGSLELLEVCWLLCHLSMLKTKRGIDWAHDAKELLAMYWKESQPASRQEALPPPPPATLSTESAHSDAPIRLAAIFSLVWLIPVGAAIIDFWIRS
jgi:hypothetical protein